MAAWSDGYVTDIQYTGQYYPELAPGALAFACLRQAVRPPTLGRGSTYLELGCGQGFGLNLLAAANPQMQFWGVDFNPAQIANATRLAADAGLSNVSFEDFSFAQMLDLPEGQLPKFDVIALHGVYSWVNAENRARIVRILDRLLKPGGLVYVSYNCLPGWSANAALQQFIREHVAQSPADSATAIINALKAAQEMQDGGALYFASAPTLKVRVASALTRMPEYLAHEYLNAGAEPLYHAAVARDMDGARLSLAASAGLADDLVHLSAPAALRPMIEAAKDRTWRETLLDYATNKIFRRDIYVRGLNPLNRPERDRLLDGLAFTLMAPADQVSFDSAVPVGTLKGDEKIYAPVVGALAEGPKTFGELVRLPALSKAADGVVLQAITLLVGRRQIQPLAGAGDITPARAFNRTLVARMDSDEVPHWLAAAATGSGAHLEFDEMIAASAVILGEDDMQATIQRAWRSMARTGRRLRKDGELLREQSANEAELARRIARFNAGKRPLLQRLGVL